MASTKDQDKGAKPASTFGQNNAHDDNISDDAAAAVKKTQEGETGDAFRQAKQTSRHHPPGDDPQAKR